MNLLEHYIKEIHRVEDVSSEYTEELFGEPLYKVDLTIDCYGKIERIAKYFFMTEWERVRIQGYFMA